jgi:hypothetical protein
MASPAEISAFLQNELKQRQRAEVEAVEAARWLDAAGLLKDRPERPGAPLRELLREGRIVGAEQRPPGRHGRWFILTPQRGGKQATGSARHSTAVEHTHPQDEHGDLAVLTENDVVSVVCEMLESHGWTIRNRAATHERGIDVFAVRETDHVELRVETKGATSSKPGTARFAKGFGPSQVLTHVAKAFFVAAATNRSQRELSAIALPDTDRHRAYAARIAEALRQLTIGVFWVSEEGHIEVDAPWDLDPPEQKK